MSKGIHSTLVAAQAVLVERELVRAGVLARLHHMVNAC
jgi:hypothetical protein